MVEHFCGHPGGTEDEEEFDAVVERADEWGEGNEDTNGDEPFGRARHRADEETSETEEHGDGAEVIELHETALEQAPAIDALWITRQPGPDPRWNEQDVEEDLRDPFVIANAAASMADGDIGKIS